MGIEVDEASVHLERPARREHGDWSTNEALVNAKNWEGRLANSLGSWPSGSGRTLRRT